MIAPHGGRLVNRALDGDAREEAAARAEALPTLEVSLEVAYDVGNLATGVFSPLDGFMTREALDHVLHRRRLPGDQAWTIPIVLDAPAAALRRVGPGGALALA
ncbi:MAG: sulfate adenylyltransferase, partial [Armatimonadota bacterium]|nr:sulfate adenylyltransferase [Armatimonadota bacterium]